MKTEFIGFLADPMEEARMAEDREKKQRERRYLCRQRALGISILISGIIAPYITDDSAAIALIFIVMGLILICTKSKIITDEDDE